MATKIRIYFDYECPYCYRGYKDLHELLKNYQPGILTIDWRPCEAHPRPEVHSPHTDLAIQGYFYAKDHGIDPDVYHQIMFSAVHDYPVDVEDAEVLADLVKDILDCDDYLEALQEGRYKSQQQGLNTEAYEEQDVWFLPAFRVDSGRKLDSQGGIGVSREELKGYLDSVAREG